MPKRRLELYREDIQGAIRKIEEYTEGFSFEDFLQDHKTIDAVVRNLEIIGEAANRIPKDIQAQHPQIPWREITGMRNTITHEYFGIDYEILWQTVQEDIPLLKGYIQKLA